MASALDSSFLSRASTSGVSKSLTCLLTTAQIRDMPLSDLDGPTPSRTMPINHSLSHDDAWVHNKANIWQTIPGGLDYISSGRKQNCGSTTCLNVGTVIDRRLVLPTRNNRLAQTEVSKHVAGPSTHKDHNIGASTSHMSHIHPSSTPRPSRPIGPLASPTRLRDNGLSAFDTETVMASLGRTSLLTGSAPDTESSSSMPPTFANRQGSKFGRSVRQFAVEDAEEFVPSYLQDSQRPPNRGNQFNSPESSHVIAPTTAYRNGFNNLHDLMIDQFPSRPGNKFFQYKDSGSAGQAESMQDGVGGRGNQHSLPNNSNIISDLNSTHQPQYTWARPDSIRPGSNRGVHPKTSTLRPEVPSYHPSSRDTNEDLNANYHNRESHATGIRTREAGTIRHQALLANSNAYNSNSTVDAMAVPRHYASQQHPRLSDSRLRIPNEGTSVNRYLASMQDPYSNQRYEYVPEPSQSSPYQQIYSSAAIGPLGCYLDDTYAQNHDDSVEARSELLEEFRLYHKNRKYEIKDLYGYIVEFSGDQTGSRFIQTKLEVANSDEKDQIFLELQSNARQLMSDVFGNYVIQKMFDHGNQSQKKTLAGHMQGYVLKLSMQPYGCRCVQKALEHVLADQQAALIKELDGHVIPVVESQHGNHVIQKAIECVPEKHIQFIVDAHKNQIVRLSKHIYGCRIIQRMLERCAPRAQRAVLDELHCAIPALIDDQYGNYVIQCIIKKCDPSDRFRVIEFVKQKVLYYSTHKFASNVVEKAIQFADDENQRMEMTRQLTEPCPENGMQSPVLPLLKDPYGNYVMQTVLKTLQGPLKKALANEVGQHLSYMPKMNRGKQMSAMADTVNSITAGHSPSSISTGPQTPRTPSSLHSGGSMVTTMAKEIDLVSHGYPLRDHRSMVPLKPSYS